MTPEDHGQDRCVDLTVVEPTNREQALADAFEEIDGLIRKSRRRDDDVLDVIKNEIERLRDERQEPMDAERIARVLAEHVSTVTIRGEDEAVEVCRFHRDLAAAILRGGGR